MRSSSVTDYEVLFVEEPFLRFAFNQTHDDPKRGLSLFGPLEDRRPQDIRIGVVGTPRAISLYREWARKLIRYIPHDEPSSPNHMGFPGFEAVFRTHWAVEPQIQVPVLENDISRCLRFEDRHVGIFETVSLFEKPIRSALRNDDVRVDIWFVVVPEEVYLLGRPMSRVSRDEKIALDSRMSSKLARRLQTEPSLFAEDMSVANTYRYEVNFHHQLKARLLDLGAVVQVIREPSFDPERLDSLSGIKRRMQGPAEVAWNLATASFFKAGGRPWKLAEIRERVCYVGLVFKKQTLSGDERNACCGAQMFLDSGDGMVFKGAMGPWYSPTTHEFHLSELEARKIAETIVKTYTKENGCAPDEIFIHGRARFNDAEWEGFVAGAGVQTKVSCITIKRSRDLKLYRDGTRPVLRGTAFLASRRRGYLWTSGYVPRLQTYPGREVPNPLSIEITHGDADLNVVVRDVLRLTKLNFNSCVYADGLPVTLRFADAVGEILTASPTDNIPPLPFRHYI